MIVSVVVEYKVIVEKDDVVLEPIGPRVVVTEPLNTAVVLEPMGPRVVVFWKGAMLAELLAAPFKVEVGTALMIVMVRSVVKTV